MRRKSKLRSILLGTLTAALLHTTAAKADELYAKIRGTVTDPVGASVPEATVTARNTATGIAKSVVSGQDGVYEFPQLAIGDYEVRAEKSGFKAFVATKIHLDVNQVYVLPVQLTLGATTEEVTVQANTTQVESSDSATRNCDRCESDCEHAADRALLCEPPAAPTRRRWRVRSTWNVDA